MRYSARHKLDTRRKIVEAAARQFRERGLDAVSVADVMSAAGLTHGGFYAHFDSKDELIAEALQSGRGGSAEKLRTVAAEAAPGQALAAMVASYLSTGHRARQAQGCVLAALGPEAGRHTPTARHVLAERSRDLAGAFLPYLHGRSGQAKEDEALAVTACLVGGMILSRLEEDGAAGERVLAACRSFVLNGVGAGAPRASKADSNRP